MSDPLRTDGSRAHADVASGADRDAKIEQLLLVGLDHYFAGRYELAINVWTRALFLDRSHARARAYIERARSALAERQRESEELLQNGVAAFQRGEGDEARRLLQAAIDGGAPSEEALAVLDRLNRLETTTAPAACCAIGSRAARRATPARAADGLAIDRRHAGSRGHRRAGGGDCRPGRRRRPGTTCIDWRSIARAREGRRAVRGGAGRASRRRSRATPRCRCRGAARRRCCARARSPPAVICATRSSALDAVRPTDPQQADADRLRADIQRQLLALTPMPSGDAPDREKGERRSR